MVFHHATEHNKSLCYDGGKSKQIDHHNKDMSTVHLYHIRKTPPNIIAISDSEICTAQVSLYVFWQLDNFHT